MAAADDKLGFLSPIGLFNFSPDKKKGIEYLKHLSQSEDIILKTEGNYFLMKIYDEMEHQAVEAEKYSSFLIEKYPENLVYCLYHLRIMKQLRSGLESGPVAVEWRTVLAKNQQISNLQRAYLSRIFEKEFP
jgi:hypothetical protein